MVLNYSQIISDDSQWFSKGPNGLKLFQSDHKWFKNCSKCSHMIPNDSQIIQKNSQKVSNDYHNGPKLSQRLAKLSKIVPNDWTQLISKFSEMYLNGPKRFPNISKSLANEMVSNDSNIPKMNYKCYQTSSKWSHM